MKKVIFILATSFALFACKKEKTNAEPYFTEGTWTQKDTIVGSVGSHPTTAELSIKGDSIVITNFFSFNTRLAFLKGTTNIASTRFDTPNSYPSNYKITDLTITKISANEFRYSFKESWAVYNPQTHRGSMKKN